MSNVWATMPCVQLSHNMLVNCVDNRQNQLFSEMSLRDVMELPLSVSTTLPTNYDVMGSSIFTRLCFTCLSHSHFQTGGQSKTASIDD